MEKLHRGAKLLFFFQSLFIFIVLAFFISSFFGVFIGFFIRGFAAGIFVLTIVLAPILAWAWAILTYNNWSYEFRKDGMYIQRGVIWKHYSSVPYERIQNIDITRGIIARLCGFSSLMVQTAGYSATGKGGFGAEGSIPALDPKKAEQYREKLLKAIRGKKQGL